MFDNGGGALKVGAVTVATTQNTGLSVEYWAGRCLDKILHVSDSNNSIISDQAHAYKEDIRRVLVAYIGQAIKSDRTTLYNLLMRQSQGDMAEILRKEL
jgi:hypothetical protein